jgi:TRAP-type mannitol/chloroaromatic compound transport system substrate-binding protein
MRDFYRQFNCVNFPMGNTGAQMGGWFRREIKSLADFKGTKFRVGGFGGRIVERIGGVPQNIPGGEIYQALEKGTIDAAEWVGPYDDLKLGFVKVAPNYAYPGWWEGGAMLELHINSKAWDSLSPEYKAIVECASAYCHTDMQAKYDGKNAVALKTLVSQGAKLFAFPQDLMDAAFRASREHYAELSARNANWKKVYEDYSAFQRDANLWFRFTEATFDNFMQRQRM